MRRFDQLLRLRALDSGQRYREIGGNSKTASRARADTDLCSDRHVVGQLHIQLLACNLQRADEARGIAGCEQLLWVGAVPAGSAQLLWRCQCHVETAIERARMTGPQSGRRTASVRASYGSRSDLLGGIRLPGAVDRRALGSDAGTASIAERRGRSAS
jgi:hypothetical protein